MQLEKIKIQKFKRISSIELNLSPINYLVGGNNAGKSSVLQAIHTAVTAAQTATELQWKIISDNQIKYCPTGNFADIGHNGPLENMSTGKRSIIIFEGKNDDGEAAIYRIELYKGRNSGAGVERLGNYLGFGSHITKTNPPFSIYVPGLAGIPHFEEYKTQAIVIRKIAGGEANSVLRNVLFMLSRKKQLQFLKERMREVFPKFEIEINFDHTKDQHIIVNASTRGSHSMKPLDLVGTGVLQALQLFAYTILFEPPLLLLDEPDSHLHPSNQQQLIKTLESISEHTNTKIILATHSRHMINNLPEDAKILWLEDGKLKSEEDFDKIKLLNDLGALDQADEFQKELLILTEDNNKKLFRKLLEQIKAPSDRIGIASYNGIANYKVAIQLTKELLRDNQKVVIHRDRDFLTEDEAAAWENEVKKFGVVPYITEGSDLEMNFIHKDHLAELSGKDVSEIESFIEILIKDYDSELRKKFRDKRKGHC
ncbi:ATP-dependent nuclease [Methylobacter sp. YRD-M1]|uniref:ATP-dependent nuclease n=1 Tax=Methylobacter sp. YRD-M1 TaxID=2911520 RepID=UPI00227A8D42|nr:AAA family ATPase [Methylobacter sp. YRD-M1]WAK04524.1 AAA family ATPase [Methylobacter sp. YRD-M1]